MMLLLLWYGSVFVVGTVVGSFLEVCVGRLPYEKSLLWPGWRCDSCRQSIRWFDRVPLLSYLVLRGRCRTCGAKIPSKIPLVELGTGLAFGVLFHLEMAMNVLDLPLFRQGTVPFAAVSVFAHHAILLSFLLAASLCDLADMEIPMSITFWGVFVGLVMSALLPWPVPDAFAMQHLPEWGNPPTPRLMAGAYPWPVWYPLPAWLPAGSWRLGLATGLAGALAGMLVLRAVRFLFMVGRGIEGMGVGDADLMMMAGAFVGWQPIILAFFVSVFPGLIFAVVKFVVTRRQDLPFGPSLSLGVLLTVLAWPAIGPAFQAMFFDPVFIGLLAVAGAVALLVTSFLLRLVNG